MTAAPPHDSAASGRGDSNLFLTIGLFLLALAAMSAARWEIGLTLSAAFLPLFVAPILAAYLPPKRATFSAIAIAVATELPLMGIAPIGSWFQLLFQTIAGSIVIAQSVSLLRSLPLRGRLGGGGERLIATPRDSTLAAPTQPPPEGEGQEDAFAQTIVILLWLGWLTWPIWLANLWVHPAAAPWLDHLLPFNPLAAIGGVLVDLGDWTHQPIAYRYLLNLGQDVPYEPPASAWPAILAHSAAVGMLLALSKCHLFRLPRQRPM